MASQTQSRPTGTSNHEGGHVFFPKSVQRVAAIPVIADTVEAVHSVIQAHPYLTAVYDKAEEAAAYIYEQSKPIQQKLAGPIGQVDAVANKGLDFVQSRAPFVFEVKTEDIISRARQPADQALAYGKTYKEAATARLGPLVDQFHSQLTRSQQTLASLQDKLQSGLQNVTKDPKAVPDQLKHLSEQLVGELGKLTQLVADKGKDLPQQVQQALSPLNEKLQKAYADIKDEMTKTEIPLTQRATHVLAYSRDQASPIVHEAITTIKKLIGNTPQSN